MINVRQLFLPIRQLFLPRYLFISGFIFMGCNIYSFYTLYNIIYDINYLTRQNNKMLLEICKISDDTSKILKCLLKEEIEKIEKIEKIEHDINSDYDYVDDLLTENKIITNTNTNWLPKCIFNLTMS